MKSAINNLVAQSRETLSSGRIKTAHYPNFYYGGLNSNASPVPAIINNAQIVPSVIINIQQ
jgi:hypothetical protein